MKALLAIAFASFAATADEPPAMARESVYSTDKSVRADLDPFKKTIAVHGPKISYVIREWHPLVMVADDGHVIAMESNLLRRDVSASAPVLWFYQRDRVIRTWHLRELMPVDHLKRTISHLAWAEAGGRVVGDAFEVELIDCRRLRFDWRTGAKVGERPSRSGDCKEK